MMSIKILYNTVVLHSPCALGWLQTTGLLAGQIHGASSGGNGASGRGSSDGGIRHCGVPSSGPGGPELSRVCWHSPHSPTADSHVQQGPGASRFKVGPPPKIFVLPGASWAGQSTCAACMFDTTGTGDLCTTFRICRFNLQII